MFHYFHALPSLCLITALAVCQSLTAQRVWDGESSGLWGTATNWSGNTVPNISEDVIFNNAADTRNPIIVGGARTINSFTYSNAGSRVFSTTAGPHSITVSGNTVISLLTGQQLLIGSATAANNVDLITGTLLKNGAGELQLFGSLTGTLEMVGGSLSLFASSTIGAVSVSGGTLTTRNSNALAGSSPVTLSGGTMRLISGLGRPIIAEAFGTIENLSDDAVRIPIMTEGTSGLGSLRIRSMISAASGTMTFSINPINHDGDLELENSGAGTSAGALGTVRINSAIGANVNNVTVRNTTTGTRGLHIS